MCKVVVAKMLSQNLENRNMAMFWIFSKIKHYMLYIPESVYDLH